MLQIHLQLLLKIYLTNSYWHRNCISILFSEILKSTQISGECWDSGRSNCRRDIFDGSNDFKCSQTFFGWIKMSARFMGTASNGRRCFHRNSKFIFLKIIFNWLFLSRALVLKVYSTRRLCFICKQLESSKRCNSFNKFD